MADTEDFDFTEVMARLNSSGTKMMVRPDGSYYFILKNNIRTLIFNSDWLRLHDVVETANKMIGIKV